MISSPSGRPATRLYIPEPLAAGALVPLSEENVHRLRNVLRLAAGATVAAFNEHDGEWLCHIDELRRSRGALKPIEQCRAAEAITDLWLVFAPIKRVRLDWLVEKATELGVAALVPVMTARTQAERVNRERLHVLALAASEQSERLSLPEIRPEVPLVRLLAEWPGERRLVLCDETGAGAPIVEALAEVPPGAPAAVFVGPEGGFAETELDAIGKLSIVTRVGLGPRVLRAETAALAALAVFQAIAGDWRLARGR
ncbi:MAG TPA: 16S rRNA (uracil(1498)-N(3))-methyltransferase [Stellaceae bacterium]|nr:16S rRNA (uracil(1498)-N(3))-methyltransferase [Stellaceae bacterium]